MLSIDGSAGEGGGQILRSSLALSAVTGTPFRIRNIRARRPKPGLMRQHLTAVCAAAEICGAAIDGAEIGSRELTFTPGAVGTAGSTTLVLQTVLPALMTADGASELRLEGGTDNPFAPPFDFLAEAFLPLLARMGPQVAVELERAGFYPAGGGRLSARIVPVRKLRRLDLRQRGKLLSRRAKAVVARLPRRIADNEIQVLTDALGLAEEETQVAEVQDSAGPGNVVTFALRYQNVTEVFTGFGRRGVPAHRVAGEIVSEARKYLATDAPVGKFLADQLLLPMALCGSGSFRTMPLSGHATTNIAIIERFLDIRVDVQSEEDGLCTVQVG